MNELKVNGKSFKIPSIREELSEKQAKKLGLLIGMKLKPLSFHKLLFFLLTTELPLGKRIWLWVWFIFKADTLDRGDCLILSEAFMANPPSCKPPFKKLSCAFVLLFPPSEKMVNATFWEFVIAENAFYDYLQTKNISYLDRLVSILYREKRERYSKRLNEDIREPINSAGIDWRMQKIKRIPKGQKILILQYFDACRMNLVNSFPEVFKSKEQAKESNSVPLLKNKPSNQKPNWMPLITSIAGSMIHFEQVANTNLFVAMNDISERIKKSKQ